MSKFFTVQSHDVRLSEIAIVSKVLPEYEDAVKQRDHGGYGFTITLRSGATIHSVYRSTMINKPTEAVATSIRAALIAALEDSDNA